MTNLTIIDKPIRQLDGLYSLNDLHRAAGSENRHRPSLFMQNGQTKELAAEIAADQSRNSCLAHKTIKGGANPGTYVCKELVYAYAMWISAKFHLQVIRAFDALQHSPQPESYTAPVTEHEALKDKHMALQDKLIHMLEHQNQLLAAQGEVRLLRRTTLNLDQQRFNLFAAQVKKVLKEHGVLNKTRLLAECGYNKDHKTARQLLDQGTNTHWFCAKRRNVYSYALNAESLGGIL